MDKKRTIEITHQVLTIMQATQEAIAKLATEFNERMTDEERAFVLPVATASEALRDAVLEWGRPLVERAHPGQSMEEVFGMPHRGFPAMDPNRPMS